MLFDKTDARILKYARSQLPPSLHRSVDWLHQTFATPFLRLHSEKIPMSSRWQAGSSHSWWVAALWFVVGLITATQVVVGMAAVGAQHNWVALFFTTVAAWMIFPFVTPVILWLTRRFPLANAED